VASSRSGGKQLLRFPIRYKILIVLLLLVAGAVGSISFTMGRRFQEDKRVYLNDLVSMVAIGAADECRTLLEGYADRLRVYARIFAADDIGAGPKAELLSGFFEDFPELIAISVETSDGEITSALNSSALAEVGLTGEDLLRLREQQPLPIDRLLAGEQFVENATLCPDMPMMTLAFAHSPRRGGEPLVVSALVHLDDLIRIANRDKDVELFVADSAGLLLAHRSRRKLAGSELAELPGNTSTPHNLAREYMDHGEEMIGGLATVGVGDLIAVARVPLSAARLASRDMVSGLWVISLVLLLVVAVAGMVFADRVTRPIVNLSRAIREIGRGEFDVEVRVESADEIGALAASFNRMAAELQERDGALRRAQEQLVQSEKMAAFGQLGAGIAHEVKNPLAGILGCAQLSLRKAERGSPAEKNLRLIEKETRRCKAIIENLLRFARQERVVMRPTDVNRVVHDAIEIVGHQPEMRRLELHEELAGDLGPVHANANQLQQVVMNLIMNAQQALGDRSGTITVRSRRERDGGVRISVSDTGPGIPEEIRHKLFEPFFTTKTGRQGTGLGLSVSYGIIKDHGGEISVRSSPGEGAVFTIHLPLLEENRPQASVSGGC